MSFTRKNYYNKNVNKKSSINNLYQNLISEKLRKELNSIKFFKIQDLAFIKCKEGVGKLICEFLKSKKLNKLQEAEMAQKGERYVNILSVNITSNGEEEELTEEKDENLESLSLDSYEQKSNVINANDVPQLIESEDEIKSEEIIIPEEIKNLNSGVYLINKKFNKSIDLSEQCEVNYMMNKTKDVEESIIFDEAVHEKSLLIKCDRELPTESINKYDERKNLTFLENNLLITKNSKLSKLRLFWEGLKRSLCC